MSLSPYKSRNPHQDYLQNQNYKILNSIFPSLYDKILYVLYELKTKIIQSNMEAANALIIKDLNWILRNATSLKIFTFETNDPLGNSILDGLEVDYPEIKDIRKQIENFNKNLEELNLINLSLKSKLIKYSKLVNQEYQKNNKSNILNQNPIKTADIFSIKKSAGGYCPNKKLLELSLTEDLLKNSLKKKMYSDLTNAPQDKKIPKNPQKKKIHYLNLSLGKWSNINGFQIKSYNNSSDKKDKKLIMNVSHSPFNKSNNYSGMNIVRINKQNFPKIKFNIFATNNTINNNNNNNNRTVGMTQNDIHSVGKASGSSTSVTEAFDKNNIKFSKCNKVPYYCSTNTSSNIVYKTSLNVKNQDIDTLILVNDINVSNFFDYTNFNIFDLCKKIGKENVLPVIGKNILKRLNIIQLLDDANLDNFLFSISRIYKNETVFYHNALHGVDVTSSVCCYVYNTLSSNNLTQLQITSVIIAALGHDLAHPGVNNGFLINSKNSLAFTYNDISVLENFHCSQLFKVLNEPALNIFDKLEDADFKSVKKMMVSEILATDMALHKDIVKKFEDYINKVTNPEIKKEEIKDMDKQPILNSFIHFADLAHNTKKFEVSCKWVDVLNIEFWKQGDREKELNIPVSPLCDRYDVNTPKSQIGFIQFVIIPSFKLLSNLFPELTFTKVNAEKNLEAWKKSLDEGDYDKKREYLNIKKL